MEFLLSGRTTTSSRRTDSMQMAQEIGSSDDSRSMVGLTQLCDRLNMASPLAVSFINPTTLVPPILSCLQKEYNPELMLLAARALTYLSDSVPKTLEILASNGNVDVLLHHLLSIQDVELSEQCLTCVEKICQAPFGAATVLKKGGIAAMLGFMDFFTIVSQRKIWMNTARMCRWVTPANFHLVKESLPIIRHACSHEDGKARHHAVMALLRILTGVHGNAKLVAEVFHDLDHTLLSIFDRGDSSEPSFSAALAVVQLAVASSEEVTRVLVESSTLFPFLLTLLKGSVGGTEGVAAFGSGGGQGYAFNHNGSFAVDGSSPLSPSIPSTGNASASGRGGLSMEQVKTLCAIFSSTLPTPRQNLLMYVNSLRQLEVEESGADRRDASTSLPHEESSNSAAGEEDNANEEEELNNTHDEDQWESDEDVDDLRTRIEGCEEIQRETNMVHARCVFGNHICSRCSKMLGLKDWYRCNQCRDYDLCCRCLLDAADVHFDGNHSFTDMHVIFPNGAAPHAVSPTETEKAKVAIFANPKLMESALAPLPSIVQLIISCESAQTRIQCINYLVSAVALANAQQLCGANVLASPISEAITTAVADPRITLNLLGVELTNLLLTKLPEHYCELFVREGVHHALDQLQKRFSERETNATRAKSAKAKTEEAAEPCSSMELEKLISTLGGWRRAISDRADSVKLRLPVAGKQSREVLLHNVVAKLRADAYEEAFNQLRGILLADTTTFELLSSHIVSELRAALQRSGDVHVILRLVATLLTTSTGKVDLPNSAVLRFIRHLHTMISHTENFQPPPLGPIRSINTQISLSLVPHGTDSGSSSASSPLAVRSRTSGGSGSDRSSSTQGGGVEAPKRTVTVSIEPLAAIWAVSSFVAGQLLSTGGRRSTRDSESPNESERLEEVLPDLMGEEEEDGVPTRESSTSNMRQQREENAPPQVWIRCGNHILPPTMTILQVVQHLGMQRTPKPAARRGTATRGGRGLPAEVQEALEALRNATTPNEQIVFHYSATPFVGSEYTMLSVFGKLKPPTQATLGLPSTDHRHPLEEAVMAALHNSFFFSATFLSEEQKDILIILGLLHECLLHWPALLRACGGGAGSLLDPSTLDDVGATTLGLLPEFPHPKLNAKAMRHCSNLLMAGQHIKVWAVPLAMDCNFLFYPSTRKFLFETSFFGTHRSLVRMQQNADAHRIRNAGLSTEETSTRTYRLVRHKKRVWREKVMECAMKVLGGRRSSGSVVWEFQFYNEAGSGLGPTREFYTLVAEALRERSRALWMSSGEGPDEKYFTPTNGLYPGVLNSEQEAAKGETVQKTFRFLGRFIARAILDEHVPGLPLSPVLIKMLRGDRCDVYDVQELNPAIGNVLVALCEAHATGSSTIRLPGQRSSFSIESLDLTFVLPVEGGCVELVPGGASMAVNATNAMSYCDAMVAMLLGRGVHRAVAGLREGFDDYIPIIALRMITGEEFHEVLNGYGEHISQTELEENCCADHGFTMSCHHVQWLLEIVASFSVEDQRKFFLFLTGSPRLPVGGVRNLRPKFTIVRKTATEDSVKEGDQLPSAMTCQNYLKLPAYESKELMERKLRQAVSEGAGAFLLT